MVRDVFRLAKENAPAIIFIDEVDAIATARFDAQTGADRWASDRPLTLTAHTEPNLLTVAAAAPLAAAITAAAKIAQHAQPADSSKLTRVVGWPTELWHICKGTLSSKLSTGMQCREVQRILMELLNQMDGFDQTVNVKVQPSPPAGHAAGLHGTIWQLKVCRLCASKLSAWPLCSAKLSLLMPDKASTATCASVQTQAFGAASTQTCVGAKPDTLSQACCR